MRISAKQVGCIHIVGIGGIGMSGIAEVLNSMGYQVQGSDIKDNANIKRLRAQGLKIFLNQKPENIKSAKVLVLSSAIADDNPEVIAAHADNKPVIRRVDMLCEIMAMKPSIAVSGSHGKTTTTSLTAAAMDVLGLCPTVISGGIINTYKTNAKLGTGQWIVVEADESDGTLTKLPARIAVITNIDEEHLDYYGSFHNLQQAFLTFIHNLPFYGLGLVSADCKTCQYLFQSFKKRKILTFGMAPHADIRASSIELTQMQYHLTLSHKAREHWKIDLDTTIHLPMPGIHNMQNSLASIGVALECGMRPDQMSHLFQTFKGIDRRFTSVGTGAQMQIIDDYAHHPSEILRVVQTAKHFTDGRVLLVVQPHRYSRLQKLMERFVEALVMADEIFLLPVYKAGEEPIPGVNHTMLAKNIFDQHRKFVTCVGTLSVLAEKLWYVGQPGDLVLCVGAGDITHWARQLPSFLDHQYQLDTHQHKKDAS